MKRIYLFDFDGTISKTDSFVHFSFFSVSFFHALTYWLKVIILYFFSSKAYLKEIFFKNFSNVHLNTFQAICNKFSSQHIERSIKKSFLDYINKKESKKIVIVSASINNYLNPWCNEKGFDLISTELEVINEKLTGKFLTPNCNGKEKVRRIKQKYNLLEYDEIHVFGNSKGDFPMLELGTHKYYKFFK